jgi:D-alanyl-D-alanine carboxypeptidase
VLKLCSVLIALASGGAVSAWAGVGTVAAQTPATAESAPVIQAKHVLDAAKADDTAFMAVIQETYLSAKPTPDQWRTFLHPALARLTFHGVLAATPTHAVVSLYDREADTWLQLTITVEPDSPHRITEFSLRAPVPPPPDVPIPPKLNPVQLAAAVEARVDELAAADEFSGAVLIAKDGRPILDKAWGFADRAARTPDTIDTQFRFGSMGKMFTAVAIMQLVQAGKIDLTAPIGRYLKTYPNREMATKVTIDELLSHTGGAGDIFGPEFMAHRSTLRDLKDYVALYGARAPEFPPGTSGAYSNYGFILLGRIVEVVSGQTYDDYVRSHIFARAHMASTGMSPETTALSRRAIGYMSDQGRLVSNAPTLSYRGTSAGGGYSTVGNFLKFANALMSNRLLDPGPTKLLTMGGVTLGGAFHPYDFGSWTPQGRTYLGHDGGAPGMNGDLRIYPDKGYTVVVLANRDPPIAGRIARYIDERLP